MNTNFKRITIKAICMAGLATVLFSLNPEHSIFMPQKVLAAENSFVNKNESENEKLEPLYSIGSVSKMYVVLAAMQLYEEGKIDIDEAVVKYIPDYRSR